MTMKTILAGCTLAGLAAASSWAFAAQPAVPGAANTALRAPVAVAGKSNPELMRSVFRCETKDGRVVFADEPCVGARKVEAWTPKDTTQGIARGNDAAPAEIAATPRTAPVTERTDPFVDCRRKGGSFDLGSRVCRLPEGTAAANLRQ